MSFLFNIFIILKIFLILSCTTFSKGNDSVVTNTYNNKRAAKFDIEITKVRSDNFIELKIDRKRKKIYKDISEYSSENIDLDKKIYITTYLRPSAKSNSVENELSYRIVERDNKRFLEINYEREPKNIYLWIIKNNRVDKLYTGVLSDTIFESIRLSSSNVYSKVLSKNNNFTLQFNRKNTTNPLLSSNLYQFSGSLNGWINSKNCMLKILISFTKQNGTSYISTEKIEVDLKHFIGSKTFSLNELDLIYKTNFSTLTLEFNFKNYNFKEVTFDFIYYAGTIGSSIKGEDKLTLIFPTFEISTTDMDFGDFYKFGGANAKAKININNPHNFDFKLKIPESIKIHNTNLSDVSIPVGLALQDNIIIGNIPRPSQSSNGYVEGSYKGIIPIEITLSPNIKGGKF